MRRQIFTMVFCAALLGMLCACGQPDIEEIATSPPAPAVPASSDLEPAEEPTNILSPEPEEEPAMTNQITVSFNGHTYMATLEDNATAKDFVHLIQEKGGSLTLSAEEYGGWEKVAQLGASLPANNAQTTTRAGDFVLYSGNQIVLFYGSNSWSYTRLGKLDGDLSALKEHLGNGDVEITFALAQ